MYDVDRGRLVEVASARRQLAVEGMMSKSAMLCATFLMGAVLAGPAGAEDRPASPVPANFTFPAGTEITYQWNYTCPGQKPCAFSCGATNNVRALTMYLGSIPVGINVRNSVIFYFYSTLTVPSNNGFRITGGPASTLSCNVNGMTLDYSGPPVGLPATVGPSAAR